MQQHGPKWLLAGVMGVSACGPLPAPPDAASEAPLSAPLSCDLTGTWGVKIEVPVSWPNTVALAAGEGTVTQFARVERRQQGTQVTDRLSVCGMKTPDMVAREVFNGERYAVAVPNALFDSGILATVAVTGTLEGTHYTSPGVTVLMGLSLPNASTAAWPPRARGIQPTDDDRDGHPGITAVTSTLPGFQQPPVDMMRHRRAAKFYLAMRNIVQNIDAELTDCDTLAGTANIPVIAGKAALNSRILGCLRTDGGPCSTAESDMVDKQQTGYASAGQAIVTMKRLAKGTCAEARAL